MPQAILVLTNVPDEKTARTIARKLVQQKLAACVNIYSAVCSIYEWQGALEESTELTLFIKTSREHYSRLQDAIKEAHPYQVPEIIAVPIVAGLPSYLAWIDAQTKHNKII